MPNGPFTPEQIAQILEEFFKTVGTRQYIGSRYVPIFGRKDEDSIEWDNTGTYEPLSIVLYQGNSYTSRQFVPVGVDITNLEFWANTGNYNAQVEQYRRETAAAAEAAAAAQADIDTLLPKADFSEENTVKDVIDSLSASVSADISALESSTVRQYDTLALATAATLAVGDVVITSGFYSANDGGGAKYIVVSERLSALDYAAGELFLHNTADYINVNQYGILGDEANPTLYWTNLVELVGKSLTAVSDFINGARTYKHFHFPAGKYQILDTLHFDAYTEISGDGFAGFKIDFDDSSKNTVLIFKNASSAFLFSGYTPDGDVITDVNFVSESQANPPYYTYNCANASNIYLHDFTVLPDSDSNVRPDVGFCFKHCANSKIDNVTLQGPTIGMHFEASWNTKVEDCFVISRGIPLSIYGANAGFIVSNCYLTANRSYTISNITRFNADIAWERYKGSGAPSAGIVCNKHKIAVDNTIIENAAYGIAVVNVPDFFIENAHMEVISNALLFAGIDSSDTEHPTVQNITLDSPTYWTNTQTTPNLCIAELHDLTNLLLSSVTQLSGTKLIDNQGTGIATIANSRLVYNAELQSSWINTQLKSKAFGEVFSKVYQLTANQAITLPSNLTQQCAYLVAVSGITPTSGCAALIFPNWNTVASSSIVKLNENNNITFEVTIDESGHRLLQITPTVTVQNAHITLMKITA